MLRRALRAHVKNRRGNYRNREELQDCRIAGLQKGRSEGPTERLKKGEHVFFLSAHSPWLSSILQSFP
jgi:hypothetical protein